MKAAFVAVAITAAAWQGIPSANPLAPTFPDSILQQIEVGKPFSVAAGQRLGFEVVEALSAEKSGGKHDLIRLEHPSEQRTYFIELSVKDRVVRAAGWVADAPAESAEPWANGFLADFARAHGFPDDLIAEDGVRALAWIDRASGLRLELLWQHNASDEAGELSAVLRKL